MLRNAYWWLLRVTGNDDDPPTVGEWIFVLFIALAIGIWR